ncbi:MAG: arabinan endo-1,5-alpha-L-arabinosidase, partial [Bacteroidales bacterium]|nr:arabinan endo-1,5-alpha-L-arabinosidase [Bacteroidales bacterium]
MDFHIRRLFFRSDGWPMVSPERYAGEAERELSESEIYGEYEFITVKDNYVSKDLGGTGQSNVLLDEEINKSKPLTLSKENVKNFSLNSFDLTLDGGEIREIKIFVGHDWENQKTTLLFTGINKDGFSIWGKKIK